MQQTFAGIYDRVVLGQPRLTLAIMFVLLLLFGMGLPQFRLDASADSLLLENDPDLKHFRELSKRYSAKEFLFITVTPAAGVFNPATTALITEMRAALKALPTVDSVVTILDVPLVKNVPGRLSEAATNYRTLESTDVNLARARAELTESPLYRNVVVSPNGATTAMRVILKDDSSFRALQNERGDLLYKRGTTHLTAAETARLASIEPQYKADC